MGRRDVRAARELVRLARMVLARSYRSGVFEHGFGNDGMSPAVVVFNSSNYPVLFAYKTGNDEARVIRCMSLSKAYDKYQNLKKNGAMYGAGDKFFMFVYTNLDNIGQAMSSLNPGTSGGGQAGGVTMRDFRMAVLLAIRSSIGMGAVEFLWDKSECVYSIEEARKILNDEYDVHVESMDKALPLPEYETGVSGNPTPIVREAPAPISAEGFEFVMNGADVPAERLLSIARRVKSLLPACLQNLCYGKVEVKPGFADEKRGGDYRAETDSIRVSAGGDEAMIGTIIHELGHRWSMKFATKEQVKAFEKAYTSANGRGVKVEKGDSVEFDGSPDVFDCIKVPAGGDPVVVKRANGLSYVLQKKYLKSISRINGQPVVKFRFPSAYASRSVSEFISECFKAYFTGKMSDPSLAAYLKPVLEGGQGQ